MARRLLLALLVLAPLVGLCEDVVEPIASWPRRPRSPTLEPDSVWSLGFVGSSATVGFVCRASVRSGTRFDDATTVLRLGEAPWGVAFSPDGKLLAVVHVSTTTVSVIEVRSGRRIAGVPGVDRARFLAWSPAGDRILAASSGGLVTVASLASESRVFFEETVSARYLGGGFIESGPYVIEVPSKGRVDVLEAQGRKVIASHALDVVEGGVALSADGRHLAVVRSGHRIRLEVRALVSGDVEWSRALFRYPTALAISADGRTVCATDESRRLLFFGRDDEGVASHTGAIRGLVLSADGRRALSVGADRLVHLWDVEMSDHLRLVGCKPALDLAAPADGKTAHVLTEDGSVSVDLVTGRITGAGDAAPRGLRGVPGAVAILDSRRVLSASFTPDGKRAFVDAGTLELWETEPLRRVWAYENTPSVVGAVGVSTDGTKGVAVHEDGELRVWSLTQPWAIASAQIKKVGVPSAIAFGPRDEWILIGTTDGRLHRFSLPVGE